MARRNFGWDLGSPELEAARVIAAKWNPAEPNRSRVGLLPVGGGAIDCVVPRPASGSLWSQTQGVTDMQTRQRRRCVRNDGVDLEGVSTRRERHPERTGRCAGRWSHPRVGRGPGQKVTTLRTGVDRGTPRPPGPISCGPTTTLTRLWQGDYSTWWPSRTGAGTT